MKQTRGKNKNAQQQKEAVLERKRKENAKVAKKAADELYPNEKWIFVGDGIWRSPRKKTGAKYSYQDEKRDAEILYSFGSVTYLVPEDSRAPGPKFDAIVDGLKMEFKNIRGASPETLIDQFYTSRKQAPNVFINLEESPLSKHDILSTLYGAVNSPKYAAKLAKAKTENKQFFDGGMIILKVKGHRKLVYLNVDRLKIK